MGAVLAEFGDCISKGTVRTDQNTTTSRIVVKEVSFASAVLTTVRCTSYATHAIRVTHLTVIGERCAYELTQRTRSVAHSSSDVKIILSSHSTTRHVSTAETVSCCRIIASTTSRVAGSTDISTWVLIGSINTIYNACSVL